MLYTKRDYEDLEHALDLAFERNRQSITSTQANIDIINDITKNTGKNTRTKNNINAFSYFDGATTHFVKVKVDIYTDTKGLRVNLLELTNSCALKHLTVNLGEKLPPYCAYVDVNSLPGIDKFLVDTNLARSVGLSAVIGETCKYPIYRFNKDLLANLCFTDIKDYEECNNCFVDDALFETMYLNKDNFA